MNGEFQLLINITFNNEINTKLFETASGDEYVLYKTDAQGTFIGEVRSSIHNVLTDIAEQCYITAIFKQKQTKELISFVAETYGDSLEHLWKKFPANAVWRRIDNRKWYGVVLTVEAKKLGIESDKIVEIIDLRIKPEEMQKLLSKKGFYPGWHMNKKNWYRIVLDGTVPTEQIGEFIKNSYALAK